MKEGLILEGQEIKAYILNSGVRCWQVAEGLGMTDSNFSRRLRKPFDEKEVAKIQAVILKLTAQNATK